MGAGLVPGGLDLVVRGGADPGSGPGQAARGLGGTRDGRRGSGVRHRDHSVRGDAAGKRACGGCLGSSPMGCKWFPLPRVGDPRWVRLAHGEAGVRNCGEASDGREGDIL